MGRFCTNCGNRLGDGDLFCPVCGTKMDGQVMASAIPNNISSQVGNVSDNIGKYAQEGIGKFKEFTENNKIGINSNTIKEHIASHNLSGLDVVATAIYALSCLSIIVIGLMLGLIPGLIVAFLFYKCRDTMIGAFSQRGCWKPFLVHYSLGAILMGCFMIVMSEAHRFAGSGIGLASYIIFVIIYLIGHKIICCVYPASKPQGAAVRLWVTVGLAIVGRFWSKNNNADVASVANAGTDNQAAMTTAAATTMPLDGVSDAYGSTGMGTGVATPVFDNSSTVTGNVDVASANGVNFDNSTELNTVPDNMGPTQVTVTDMTGGTQETITQVSDNRYEIKDSMGITHGNVYVNDGTGETMINVDGQTLVESSNGEIRNPFDPNGDVAHAQPDGSVIVTDNMGQYAGGVTSDGTMVDAQMNPVGKIQKN